MSRLPNSENQQFNVKDEVDLADWSSYIVMRNINSRYRRNRRNMKLRPQLASV